MNALDKKKKRQIRIAVLNIGDRYCKYCEIYKRQYEENPNTASHYCLTECEIGMELQRLGKMLEIEIGKGKKKMSQEEVKVTLKQEVLTLDKLTPGKYLEMKRERVSDFNIGKKYQANSATFTEWKKKHGMEGVRLGTKGELIIPGAQSEEKKEVPKQEQVQLKAQEVAEKENTVDSKHEEERRILQAQILSLQEEKKELLARLETKEKPIYTEHESAIEMLRDILSGGHVQVKGEETFAAIQTALQAVGADFQKQSVYYVSLR